MSILTIYAFSTIVVRANITPDATSQQQVALMREDILVLNFNSPTVINFQIGDYCTFINKLYQINQLPKRTRTSERNIQYSLTMEAEYYDLAKVEYVFLDSENNIKEPVFPLRGKLRDFADLMIFNLLRVFPLANWILGQVEDTDYMTISFSGQNCLQVLQTLATTFNTEYLVEGKVINIFQRQDSNTLKLQYGIDKPLIELTESNQDSANVITRLYAYGSTKNITASYRNGSQRLKLGDTPYIEKNVALYRINEQTIIFDGTNGLPEIYPHRTGIVSAVDDPFNFEDADIDFDVNSYLIPGVVAQLTFNTGLLSGYTFTLSAYDDSTKKFTLNVNNNDPNFIVPNTSYLPAVGDTYVITNIEQPQSYIDAAEAELKQATQNYLSIHSTPPVVYSGTCNAIWFKENNPSFKLADKMPLIDEGFGINTTKRLTGYTRNYINIFAITMELSDTVPAKSIIVKLLNGL